VQRLSASGTVHGPDERVSAGEALAAYTRGAAFAARAEQHRGTLSPRLAADLVLLEDDPAAVAADAIAAVGVLATMVGGRVSYDDGGLLASVGLPEARAGESAHAR
jgi:predicted amidohydrolase YtcJ